MTSARNCYEIYEQDLLPGIYNLNSIGPAKCLQYGWTVIQHRGQYGNPKDYFSKDWVAYVKGFGSAGIKQKY